MNTNLIYKVIVTGAIFLNLNVRGQTVDSVRAKQIEHFKKELSVNQAKALKVQEAMEDYKLKARAISSNTSYTEAEKRRLVEKLIAEKNSRLEKLLTVQQYEKVVPLAERKKISN